MSDPFWSSLATSAEPVLVFLGACVGIWTSTNIGRIIGRSRGDEYVGGAFGFFLGPLGWTLAACMKDSRPRCPYCQGALPAKNALACMHCTRELPKTDSEQSGDAQAEAKSERPRWTIY